MISAEYASELSELHYVDPVNEFIKIIDREIRYQSNSGNKFAEISYIGKEDVVNDVIKIVKRCGFKTKKLKTLFIFPIGILRVEWN